MVNWKLRETLVSKFETKTKKSSLRDAKSAENETSRIITNASQISRSGQNFPRPTFFKEPFYTPNYISRASNELFFCFFSKYTFSKPMLFSFKKCRCWLWINGDSAIIIVYLFIYSITSTTRISFNLCFCYKKMELFLTLTMGLMA